MAIELVNIDDRLIHGQIVTSWVAKNNIESIIVVNDAVANDPIQKKVVGLAAPGKKVSLFGIDQFVDILKTNEINRVTMLIFTTPIDVLRVVEAGVEIPVVNVSGMRFGDGRKRLRKNVSVTVEEEQAFKKLIELGVSVGAQTTLTDSRADMKELLK